MSKYKIIMTGGGSAGHVTPNLALIPKLKDLGYDVVYIGSKNGIEKEIIEAEEIKYFPISSGKLRRYFDIKNFTDPFKVIKGLFDSIKIIRKEKPDIIFSKGGFVAVPVIIAGGFLKIPTIAHESDMTPGLANRISIPYCTKVCVTFSESVKHIKNDKGVITGTPIREEIMEGNKTKGLKLLRFTGSKPVILVIGGSLGSKAINDIIREALNELTVKYDIVHICGKGNIDISIKNNCSYKQFEYVKEELKHYMAAADLVISRAGANAIFELLALCKPNILIPLSKASSRGDQILNAESFEKNGYSMVIQEEDLTKQLLLEKVDKLNISKGHYIEAMKKSAQKNGVDNIIKVITSYTKK
ncbi:undecaprenyldiphospho-muramoylpentapeptide beta-N-acetylglucosaminyltransferase [Clostridium cellulovorans]|uniref:UDP-N-acetylglucosamine--N-acetylmuramyl-(pentapeptide) pyrophosphoryl-undecaprenol N-acetylglucosamine transferase n=2 Tax=Clostridium cellulovorans TaxID=1493 RepID=D9SPU9_CLOC7|nr:undecaprenyldiphospho-muramoylpentapeptide beta-N-acetylglucosaminyltransferase [Clostridium cellulovorans]ADL52085.1 UDP-N-acetylglucosamine--N-acetylmuramyl-(pentapeptide) pyrophosphoryl-undecaprenol N-acetylglucosamine transferase [Clostridium cellulovorans 743B]BAV13177.1 N-acetylglucosaminyl transferase [Clostridium cellulovorans]